MKTILPAEIKNVAEAMLFLTALNNNGESYHPEDRAEDCIDHLATKEECDECNKLMNDIYSLPDFDPCEFLLDLDGMTAENEEVDIIVPPQIGCIIPIWGSAVNRGLKEFIVWFNENYEVKKK